MAERRKPGKPETFVPKPESKAKRIRPWEQDPEHHTRSYRDIPDSFHSEILALAEELQVSTGQLLYYLAAYGLEAYRSGRLQFQFEPKARRMTISGVNTDE